MDKVKMTTPDGVTENIEKLAALFPAAVTEMRGEDGTLRKGIDFEKLRQLLSRDIVEGGERYEFSWVGKKAAMAEAARPTTETLRPVKADSRDWDTTENLYIEGDNLAALKILQESYLGKVKMIYIDPPYNTGNDFIYADDFMRTQDEENEQMWRYDEDENHLFKNTDNIGRFHSDWCSMMYARLKIARNLLSEDGVIFISIDDNEYCNLFDICNEVFGAENRLETFHLQVRYGNKSLNEKDDFQKLIEYVLIFAKNKRFFHPEKEKVEYDLGKFNLNIVEKTSPNKRIEVGGKVVDIFYPDSFDIEVVPESDTKSMQYFKETWVTGSIYSGTGHGKVYQKVVEPRVSDDGYGCLYKIYGLGEDGLGYRYMTGPKKQTAKYGKMYNKVPLDKLEGLKSGDYKKEKPILNFYDYSADFGNIRHEGGISFNSGKKPTKLLRQFLRYIPKENFTVLDFFSGSATTAHAVMQLNAEDGGHRKFIMVQLPEPCDEKSEAYKAGYKNICEIGKERIRRAGDKIKVEHPDADLDIGFRVFRVDSSNMQDVYYKPEEFTQTMLGETVSNIKPDRTDLDLLYACLLDCGVPIHLPHTTTTVDGCTIHNVDNGALMACFDEHIPHSVIRAMAAEAPLQVIFRDSAFAADADKINVTEIFKNLSPDTKVRVI